DLLAVDETAVFEDEASGGRSEEFGPHRRELTSAGHEIGVQVRLGDEGDVETQPVRRREIRRGVADGIDDESPAVADVDEVRGVAESFVDEPVDVRACRHGFRATNAYAE